MRLLIAAAKQTMFRLQAVFKVSLVQPYRPFQLMRA